MATIQTFKGVVRLTKEQLNTLINTGSLSDGTTTITYDPETTIYLTPQEQASTNDAGVILIATDQDVQTGTDTTKAVTPAQLKSAIIGVGTVFTLKGVKSTASELPTSGNTIGDVWYVSSESVGYVWLNDGTSDRWEQLGLPIDLSGYVKTTDIATSNKAGIVKVWSPNGIQIAGEYIYTMPASPEQIKDKTNGYVVLTPTNNKYAIVEGLTNNPIALTDEEKGKVQQWLGLVNGPVYETIYDRTSSEYSLNWGQGSNGMVTGTVMEKDNIPQDLTRFKNITLYFYHKGLTFTLTLDLTGYLTSKCANYFYVLQPNGNGGIEGYTVNAYITSEGLFCTEYCILNEDEYPYDENSYVYKIVGEVK